MKRAFKISVIVALSLSAYSNTLMPEVSRDGKTLNSSVLAVSQESRNFAGLTYEKAMLELDDTSALDYDLTTPGAYGAFSANGFSAQLITKFSTAELDKAQSSYEEVSLLTGYIVNEKMTLGLGYSLDEYSSDVNAQKLEAGGTLKFDDVVFAGSVAYREVDETNLDGGYFILTAGMGQQDKYSLMEAGARLMSEGSDNLTRGKRFSIFSNMTKIVQGIEIDGSLNFGFGNYLKDEDDANDGNNYTSLDFSFDAEFLLAKGFYVTPGFAYSSNNAPGVTDDTSAFKIGADLGYRYTNFDATVAVDYIFVGEENDVDYDGISTSLDIAYLF